MSESPRFMAPGLGDVLRAQGRKHRWLAAQVGCHESLVSHLIRGNRSANRVLAERIAAALGMEFGVLWEYHRQHKTSPGMGEREAA